MDEIGKMELRLLCDIFTDDYRKVVPSKPMTDYIQLRIYQETGLKIAKSKIINIKPFKKIVKKSVIHKGRIIRVLRKRNKNTGTTFTNVS